MIVMTILIHSANLWAQDSRLDEPVWTMRLDASATAKLNGVLAANGLTRDARLEDLVRLRPTAWFDVGPADLRKIRQHLAFRRLHTSMSPGDLIALRADPYDPAFVPIACGPHGLRRLHVYKSIYLNVQLVRYAAERSERTWFDTFPPVARAEALECLARARRRMEPSAFTSRAFEVRSHADTRRRPLEDMLPYTMWFRLKEYGGFNTVGDVIDEPLDRIVDVLGMGPRSGNDLEEILAGHGMHFFGREFVRLGVRRDLNERLAAWNVRTAERLQQLADHLDARPGGAWPAQLTNSLTDDDHAQLREAAARLGSEHRRKLEVCRDLLVAAGKAGG